MPVANTKVFQFGKPSRVMSVDLSGNPSTSCSYNTETFYTSVSMWQSGLIFVRQKVSNTFLSCPNELQGVIKTLENTGSVSRSGARNGNNGE